MTPAIFAAILAAVLLALALHEWRTPMLVVALVLFCGCAALPGYRPPSLDSIAGAVDVERAIACAEEQTPKEKAKCLGVTVLDGALGIALEQAASLGRAALRALSGAGADDIDEDQLARDLDIAMSNLNTQISAQRALGE
jgi:hypothetical protein